MTKSQKPKFKSSINKRSVVIDARKSSVSIEDPFWSGLKEIARARKLPLTELINQIDRARTTGNLSSTLRLFVLEHYRKAAQEAAAAE